MKEQKNRIRLLTVETIESLIHRVEPNKLRSSDSEWDWSLPSRKKLWKMVGYPFPVCSEWAICRPFEYH